MDARKVSCSPRAHEPADVLIEARCYKCNVDVQAAGAPFGRDLHEQQGHIIADRWVSKALENARQRPLGMEIVVGLATG